MLGVFSAFSLQYPIMALFNSNDDGYPFLLLYILLIWIIIIVAINMIFWSKNSDQKVKDD